MDSELRTAAAIAEAAAAAGTDEGRTVTRTRITADGTYATESSFVPAGRLACAFAILAMSTTSSQSSVFRVRFETFSFVP